MNASVETRAQHKRPVNLLLTEETVQKARGYTNNLSATVDGLLVEFVARIESQDGEKQQRRNEVCELLNRFNAINGSFADEFSTL